MKLRLSILLVAAVILVAYGLLTYDLDTNSVWTDEEATLEVVSQPTLAAFLDMVATREGRPPLYYFLLRNWIVVAGRSDFSVRYLSVLLSTLGIALAFALGRALLGQGGAFLAALLTATAPYYVLYGRMIRAYPLTVVVGLASCLFFVLLLKKDRPIRWIGYGLVSIALMYSDYFVMALIAAQNLIWLVTFRRQKLSWRKWIVVQVVLAAAFAAWVPSVIKQGAKYGGEADFARGFSAYIAKLLYPLYSFTIGETIFPWHPAALIGVPLALALALAGCAALYRRNRTAFFFVTLAFLVPLLFTVFVASTWLVPVLPFITFGSRMMFAGPLLYLPIAAGLLALRRLRWQSIGLAIIVLTRAFALSNYYTNRDFHNAIYVVPTREIAAVVRARAQPGDVVIANDEIPFDYYTGNAPLFDRRLTTEAPTYVERTHPARIWVVRYERDRSTAVNPLDSLVTSIQEDYVLIETNRYTPQDPLYGRIKAALLRHTGYEYKASLFLYERVGQ